ncbi:MAG TPA: CotH kinase family protein, partial [Clostridia bacterium]
MRKLVSCITVAALLTITSAMPGESYEAFAQSKQALFINEVMASNKSTIRDGDVGDPDYGGQGGAYSDWIEIYNSGAKNVDLTGYTISDDTTTWVFPKGVVPTKGYLLVWASNKDKIAPDGQLHTNFKMSSSGETITLKDPQGILVDSVKTGALTDDNSYGREEDGSNNFVIFKKATPGSENKGETNTVKEPEFSRKGGFYTSGFTLKLNSDDAGTNIYYTTDGSDPVPEAAGTKKYTDGITIKSRAGEPNVISVFEDTVPTGEVFKCSIIKAVSVKEDGSMSKIITNSYFVDPSIHKKFDLPVISLVTDNSNFFDSTKGIYSMYNSYKSGPEWERPIHVEFFEKNGDLGFSHSCGVRLNGRISRDFPQKALRLYADREYDDTNRIDYKIFPGLTNEVSGNAITSFERLLLRASGSDCSRTMFRDALVQSLAEDIKLDTQAYRPCQVFLNGEYWGLYNIRERYDNKYFASHYNLDKDKVALLEYGVDYYLYGKLDINEGTKEDEQAYLNDVVKYVETNSLSEESNYDYIKTKVDVDNFIDHMIVNIFASNLDWPGSNFAMWRYKTDDGKYHPEAPYGQDGRWRYIIKDCDMSFGQYGISDASLDRLSYVMNRS